MDVGSAPGHQRYRIENEAHDRPTDRRQLYALVEHLIDAGGVQRLVIQSGEPVRVKRMVPVPPDDPGLPESPEDDLMAAIRNAEMEEFALEGKLTAFEYLFKAFRVFSAKKLRVVAIIANNKKDLAAWLKVESHSEIRDVFGADVAYHKEVPHDAVVLVGAPPDLPDAVSFSLRLELNVTKK